MNHESHSAAAGATVRVRPAGPTDAVRLAALSGALGYPVAGDVMEARLACLLSRPTDLVLVAETGAGVIIGWIHAAEQELLESDRRAEILGLVVDSAHRGHGAGRRLVAGVEAWAARRGLEHIAVRSNIARTESHPFYLRLGYVRVKTQHAYRKRLATSSTSSND